MWNGYKNWYLYDKFMKGFKEPWQDSIIVDVAWGQKVSYDFVNKVFAICEDFGWTRQQANHLMACMAFESAYTFSPSIKNMAGSGATGLIQFMPVTARNLGTSIEELELMNAIEQLEYVQKYFDWQHKRIKTLADMYMGILMPKYVGRPSEAVLFNEETIAYRQNSGLDADKNGKITKLEAASKVYEALELGLQFENVKQFTLGDNWK